VSRLTAPVVGAYLATTTAADNVTSCLDAKTKSVSRCYGLSLDPVNLVYPIAGDDYFGENTKYLNYDQQAQSLRTELAQADIRHLNNYWTTLDIIRAGLAADKANLPLYAHSAAWQSQALRTAAGAWVNFQLPADNLVLPAAATDASSSELANEDSYVEPNLELVNELGADDNMLLGMLSALQLDTQVRLAWQNLKDLSADLLSVKAIMVKELSGADLNAADDATISRLVGAWQAATPAVSQELNIKSPAQVKGWREDLGDLQLMVLVHQSGGSPVFAVGPVWNPQETH